MRGQVARRVIPQLEEMERKALAHEGLLNRFNRSGYEDYLEAARQVPEAIGRRDYAAAREKCEIASLLLFEAMALARRRTREHGPGTQRAMLAMFVGAILGGAAGGIGGAASVPVILVGAVLGAVSGAVLVAVAPRLVGK